MFDAGSFNSSFGWFSQFLASPTGLANTAVGAGALDINQASSNTAAGAGALFLNQTATFNTAVGTFALAFNDSLSPPTGTANSNTAVGTQALFFNVDASNNTALGARALFNNSSPTAFDNTAVGTAALFFNVGGADNTAVGFNALLLNTISEQTAVGSGALAINATAPNNVAVGFNASNALVGGGSGGNGFSVAVGYKALQLATDGQNTAVGDEALSLLTTGVLNTAIGDVAGSNYTGGESNNVCIGLAGGFTGESNAIHISDSTNVFSPPATDCFIGGIFGNLTPGVAVFIDGSGHLSTTFSSRRFKDEIKPMGKTSEAIYSLKP